MKKSLVGITLTFVALVLTGCGQTTNANDRGTTISVGNTVPSGHLETQSFAVPSESDVKSMTASVSALPGSKKETFTKTTDKATIEQILAWLRTSKEVGPEKPPIGKGGYPPSLQIELNNDSKIFIEPAVNWSSKKLANGTVEIQGLNVEGYIAVATPNSKAVRLHAPDLYNWIVKHKWE